MAAPTLIGSISGVGTTAALDTSGANLLVAMTAYDTGATFSDNKSNSWSTAVTNTTGNTDGTMYYCVNPTVGSGHTFSMSLAYCTSFVLAFSTTVAASVDQTNSAYTNSATSLNTGSITPTSDGQLLISGMAVGGNGSNMTENTALNIQESINSVSGVSFGGAIAYGVQNPAAALNSGWGWTNSAAAAAMIASFIVESGVVSVISENGIIPT